MPFLFLIGLYAVRIARRPLDVRLKKRHAGPMAVVAVWIVLYLAWDWLKPAGTATVAFVGEYAGVTSVYLMVWALVLASRIRWLEQWFGGLDRMYLWHKRYAVWSMVVLVPHIVLSVHAEPRGAGYVLPRSVFQGHVLGVVSAVGMLALVLVSLARVGRILRLPYAWWLLMHRLIGLLVLIAVVHGWLVDPVIGGSLALQTLYIGVGAVGMAAYAYDELVMRRRTPRAEYTVRAVERRGPDIVDVTLAPAGPAALPVRGGQFVYLRVGGHRAWREHPFSVAGTSRSGSCCRSRWSCARRWPCSTGSSSTWTWYPTSSTLPTPRTCRRSAAAAGWPCGRSPSATPARRRMRWRASASRPTPANSSPLSGRAGPARPPSAT